MASPRLKIIIGTVKKRSTRVLAWFYRLHTVAQKNYISSTIVPNSTGHGAVPANTSSEPVPAIWFISPAYILAWTCTYYLGTESKVLNYVLIAESTVLSTGAGLAASLSFGETSADLLGMVGDNLFHSI